MARRFVRFVKPGSRLSYLSLLSPPSEPGPTLLASSPCQRAACPRSRNLRGGRIDACHYAAGLRGISNQTLPTRRVFIRQAARARIRPPMAGRLGEQEHRYTLASVVRNQKREAIEFGRAVILALARLTSESRQRCNLPDVKSVRPKP
jgi:hypothetical protein